MNPHTFLLRSKSSGRLHKKNYNLTNHFAVMPFVSVIYFSVLEKMSLLFCLTKRTFNHLLECLLFVFYGTYFQLPCI
jgi:hypothetical protein